MMTPYVTELCFGAERVKVWVSQNTSLPARTEKVVLGQVNNVVSLDSEGEQTLVCFYGQPVCPAVLNFRYPSIPLPCISATLQIRYPVILLPCKSATL